jgi:hypothetical protein
MQRWSDLGDDSQPDQPKVKRGGIHIPLVCKHCSYEAEAVVNWQELAKMYARQQVPGATLTETGYVLITLCPRCEKHYRDQGKALDSSRSCSGSLSGDVRGGSRAEALPSAAGALLRGGGRAPHRRM